MGGIVNVIREDAMGRGGIRSDKSAMLVGAVMLYGTADDIRGFLLLGDGNGYLPAL